MISARTPTGLQAIKGIAIRVGGGALQSCKAAYLRDSGSVLRTVFNNGLVAVTPSSVAGYANSKVSVRIITNFATASVVGGTAPYAAVWTVADAAWNATSPAGLSTGFRSPSLPAGSDASTSAYVTVTDANGAIFTSSSIEITASNLGFN